MKISNTKEIREALTEAVRLFSKTAEAAERCGFTEEPAWVKQARAALATPPRNCDVGTPEEQERRFSEYCRRTAICERCVDCMDEVKCLIPYSRQCAMEWSQMPYEAEKEGDNNGSK